VNKLKEIRLSSGIGFIKAAKELNISATYLYYIETGARMPGRDLLIRMSKLYECKLDEIFLALNLTKC
jgi:putative transcriptional regulator